MDNLNENGESTVFSAPQCHDDEKLKSPKKSKIVAAVMAFLAVLILVGGTVAVIKFIPEKEEKDNSIEIKEISVLDLDEDMFDTVTVENKNGKFELYPKSDENDGIVWYAKNFDEESSASKSGEVVSAAGKIDAIMEITKKSFSDCGFDKPSAKVSVDSDKLGDFYILFGALSPDNMGIYLFSSLDEKIYLVNTDVAETFDFSSSDF